jgi:hypothetical protein
MADQDVKVVRRMNQIPETPATPSRLDQQRDHLFADLPALFQQVQETINSSPVRSLSAVVVRTYTTYSAYEDPITE